MTKMASPLKDEVARMLRKEVRLTIEPLKAQLSTHQQIINELRRGRGTRTTAPPIARTRVKRFPLVVPLTDGDVQRRFSPSNLRALRGRLELSAAELGLLVGVSGPTIYNWETDKARPDAAKLGLIAGVRSLSKQQAQELIEKHRKPTK